MQRPTSNAEICMGSIPYKVAHTVSVCERPDACLGINLHPVVHMIRTPFERDLKLFHF